MRLKIRLGILLICFLSCHQSRLMAEQDSAAPVIIQDQKPFYVHYRLVFPGQTRYSSAVANQKAQHLIDQGAARWDKKTFRWIAKYEEGQAVLSLKDPIPVIKACFGYVAIDGHHHVIASLLMGANRIPILVKADLSHVKENEFWDKAEEHEWVYQWRLDGTKKKPPRSFLALEDDPNRYFATVSVRKIKDKGKQLAKSTGAEYPLWIKIGRGRPFAEFYISDALKQAGIEYNYQMGKEIPQEFVEKARKALVAANLPGIIIVPERLHYSQLQPLISLHR